MATCARICNEIGVNTVAIDYSFCEFLSEYNYSKNPMPKLELRNKDLSTLNSEYELQDIGFVDSDQDFAVAVKLHPETDKQGAARAVANVDR